MLRASRLTPILALTRSRAPRALAFVAVLALLAVPVAAAEDPSLAGNLRSLHGFFMSDIQTAAEQASEEDYTFRPSEDVRSFGEIIGHVAETSYFVCSMAADVETPEAATGIEDSAAELGKAALVAKLAAARAYCDDVYRRAAADLLAPPARAERTLQPTVFEDRPVSRAAVLAFQATHLADHYGNLVVYLRLLGQVPPSTARVDARRAAERPGG